MNLILTGTIENISTRADKTMKVVIGTQEIDNESAGKLVSFRGSYTKILLSTDQISEDAKEAVINAPFKEVGKKYSRSQELRFALFKLHKASEVKESFDDFYDTKMANLIINYENEAYELIEQSK